MGNRFSNISDLQSDERAELEGVDLEFGGGRSITIARAGGANRRYRTALSEAYRPHKMAMEKGTLDEETAARLLREVVASSIVIGWKGWLGDNGEEIPCNKETVLELFEAAPEVFATIQAESDKFSNFARQEVTDSGN